MALQTNSQPRPSDGRRLSESDAELAAEQARRAAQLRRIYINGLTMKAASRMGHVVFAEDVALAEKL